jgi:hypothetical protein
MGKFGLACGGLVARRRMGYREHVGGCFFLKGVNVEYYCA